MEGRYTVASHTSLTGHWHGGGAEVSGRSHAILCRARGADMTCFQFFVHNFTKKWDPRFFVNIFTKKRGFPFFCKNCYKKTKVHGDARFFVNIFTKKRDSMEFSFFHE